MIKITEKFQLTFILIFLFVSANKVYGQLGFCSGNSGDPIFTETFGAGLASVELPAETTTYLFANSGPNDGFYTVSNNSNAYGWHVINDHSLNDNNGRMLIVNASYTAGEFYKTSITGLCENTTYEFSAWMLNLLPASGCSGNGIPINVKFQIWDSSDTNLLASGDTGNIYGTSSPNWEQYALVFQALSGQTSVILKMINNGVGGCGNDLAIDDIVFKSCGDSVTVIDEQDNSQANLCKDQLPYFTQLSAQPDYSIFSTHFYQWQQSDDGVVWEDIAGETNEKLNISALIETTFFRTKIAEDPINVNNDYCNTVSDVFEIQIIDFPEAPVSNGDLLLCEDDLTPLSVAFKSGILVNWYDAENGGNLLLENSNTFKPMSSGIYYAEAQSEIAGCVSQERTGISVTYFERPIVYDESLEFCENTFITLNANVENPTSFITYLWNNGETTEAISVSQPGIYSVMVSNNNCTVTKTVELIQIDNPVIYNVISDGSNIIVKTANEGNFLYSIDGFSFQSNNVFSALDGGIYTVYVKENSCTEVLTSKHLHFYIPKYFTPNGDGIHDKFNLKGIEHYNSYSVSIFDRYGKLLKFDSEGAFSWDGTFNNVLLPSGDYWYIITIEDQKFTGHFTLKH
ncbi:T9SS type B sorting domain-containing protein [Aestuariibaculum suncheonense]|uniref:T9SS type B sorting domain-containing protein n=1 Tax=Aestuariibaculum suncheonense TaxID=1028745 RepID=A0A8J6QYI0_9FLAO|nr:T9SS type B sorting domain-containing protein [Aestuariibaculum suncheonense]MBD0836829.1 T9SS type B sorting domain-containing protein [Aestuariibaculum suncheonense]